jgi:hypothetical protein
LVVQQFEAFVRARGQKADELAREDL